MNKNNDIIDENDVAANFDTDAKRTYVPLVEF